MTKRFKRPFAFMLAVIMAMTLNLSSGISGIFDLVKTANAATVTATQPTSGDGSSSSPYQIGTAGELLWFANQVNGGSTTANAVLTTDIDLSGIDSWTPIGTSSNGYAGTFDGKDFTIKNMSITNQGTYSGLFGYTSGAAIQNIKITGSISLTTTSYTEGYGSIAGGASDTDITNCHSSVNITISKDSTIDSSRSTCIGHIGGIVGQVLDTVGTVSECSYSGTIELNDRPVNVAAGIAAYCSYNSAPTIKNCRFTGAVNSTYTSAQILGGVLGYINSTYSVNLYNCLSAGTITKSGSTSTNGMIIGQINNGYGNNCVKNNYYLSSSVSGIGSTTGTPTTTPATACTTDELKSGKIAYLLSQGTDGSVWGQDLSQDSLPTLYGNTVYYNESADPQYSNSSEGTEPDEPQPDESQPKGDGSADNPYQIENYTQLVWFQQFVDSSSDNYGANAVLTADITANKNLLNDSGEVSGTPEFIWTPIRQSASTSAASYSGVFDGQGHTIRGLYAPKSSSSNCALFGSAKGTIKNIFITDSYFGGSGCYQAASFVGYGFGGCVIENCGSDAVVVGSYYCGGIAGQTTDKITSSYFAGKISGNSTSSAIASDYYGRGTLTNCYYIDNCGLTSTRATSKTASEFASGEVCYKLNNGITDGTQAWYQTIGTDKYPTFSGGTVYRGYNEETAQMEYANSPLGNCPHSSYTNGFCDVCGELEAPELIDGKYQIASYGNLVWFQQFVDSSSDNYGANAILTEDITANENLLNDSGEVSGTPTYTWKPIRQSASNSSTCYSGVFDGQGHTIRGLYAPKSSSNKCALFGYANGTIKNIFITDSYFGGSGCNQAASFVGYGYSGCVIENCGSDAVVVGSVYCGGIAGLTYGKITSCYFAGKISADTTYSSAIASDYYVSGTLTNCYYLETCGLPLTVPQQRQQTSLHQVRFAISLIMV